MARIEAVSIKHFIPRTTGAFHDRPSCRLVDDARIKAYTTAAATRGCNFYALWATGLRKQTCIALPIKTTTTPTYTLNIVSDRDVPSSAVVHAEPVSVKCLVIRIVSRAVGPYLHWQIQELLIGVSSLPSPTISLILPICPLFPSLSPLPPCWPTSAP